MGHSREDKERSHQRIVDTAARRFRESGVAGPGVAELMREAGLTHGGFYKHFGSRDDLVAEAVQSALTASEAEVDRLLAGAADPLVAFVDWYASAEHRDSPGTGCGVVALGADAARGDPRVRTAYAAQVQRYLERLTALLGDRRRAAAALGTLVGAVLVARAVGPGPLSEEILAAARDAVTAPGAPLPAPSASGSSASGSSASGSEA